MINGFNESIKSFTERGNGFTENEIKITEIGLYFLEIQSGNIKKGFNGSI
jgi:hypothetical protein